LMITRRQMCLGGLRLILDGIPKLRFLSYSYIELEIHSRVVIFVLKAVSVIINVPATEVHFPAIVKCKKKMR
jgi:hypothetical protein